jgi:hypothetical protein
MVKLLIASAQLAELKPSKFFIATESVMSKLWRGKFPLA